MNDPVEVKITLRDAAEIISERTGEDVTPETHWITGAIEMTRDAPQYAVITLKATKR